MKGLNRWEGLGNLTRDPEVRYSPNGTAFGNLSMAINRQVFDREKNASREEVDFIDVTVFGKTAEITAEHLKKGSPIHVEGRLRFETWKDKETGQDRHALKVIGEQIRFLQFPTRSTNEQFDGARGPNSNRGPNR